MTTVNESMKAYRSGRIAYGEGEYEKATTAFRWASGLDPDNPMYGHSAALSALKAGDEAGAERLFLRAVLATQRTLGPDHPFMVLVTQDLAGLYAKQGRAEEMRNLARRVIACISPLAIAQSSNKTLRSVADLCDKAGRLRAAIPFYRSALSCRRDLCGDSDPKTLECLAGLAEIYGKLGDFETSQNLLTQTRHSREIGGSAQAVA